MALFSIFQSKQFNADKFEKDLKLITKQITKTDYELQKYTKSFKSYRLWLLIYLGSIYVCYVAYFFHYKIYSVQRIVPAAIGPFFIYFLYCVYNLYVINYMKRTSAYLVRLREQHGSKIQELKDITNFNKTNNLLKEFSNGENVEFLKSKQNEIIQREKDKLIELENTSLKKKQSSGALVERVFEKLLGNDEMGPEFRYALICSKCSIHNGLAPPGRLPEEIVYICPNCGTMNNKKSLKDGKETSKVIDTKAIDESIKPEEPSSGDFKQTDGSNIRKRL